MSHRDNPAVAEWIAEARGVQLALALERAASGALARLKKAGGESVGPCPACGGTDRFSINPRKGAWNCRGAGGGHDAIGLAMHAGRLEFLAAVEIVTGRPNPAGGTMSEAEWKAIRRRNALRDADYRGRAAFEARAGHGLVEGDPLALRPGDLADDFDLVRAWARGFDEARKKWRAQERYRQDAIGKARLMWGQGVAFARSDVLRAYFVHRGVIAFPPGLALRLHPDLDLYGAKGDKSVAPVLHRGPAMLAPIVDRHGAFIGVQRTWFSWDEEARRFRTPNGKIDLIDPATGEKVDPKKVQGSQRSGIIPLGGHSLTDAEEGLRFRDARALVMGEGRETVLSVYSEMRRAGRDLRGWFFADSVNLGNLGGHAIARVKHPTRKTTDRNGKVRAVYAQGPEPDMAAPGLWIPPSVETLFLLKDGDSDPFDTEQALQRGAKRFRLERQAMMRRGEARCDLDVRIADAPAGMDFNDVVRRAA